MKNLQPWEHSNFYDAYTEGSLIEESFGLLPLADIVSEPSVIGASRFFFLPASGAERIVKLGQEKMYFSREWCRQIGRRIIKSAAIDGNRLEQRLDP